MVKRGVGPGEGYAKAREDQILNDARQNTGALGSATEMLGGGLPQAAWHEVVSPQPGCCHLHRRSPDVRLRRLRMRQA
jgi:hypothetical protein